MNAHQWGFENYSSFIPRRKRLGYRKVISTWDTTLWLQAPPKAPRIQRVLKIKSVSGEPSSFERAAESPGHCPFLIADCRFDHRLENPLFSDQSTLGNWHCPETP